LKFHSKGTVITIEGNRFSTKAESDLFRVWGADVINMSIAPEAILAKEEFSIYKLETDIETICMRIRELNALVQITGYL